MSTSLGELALGLSASKDRLQSDLLAADRLIKQQYQEWTRLGQSFQLNTVIKPIVDDSALTALNRHLSLKQSHLARVRSDFAKPLVVSADYTTIDEYSRKLDKLQKQSRQGFGLSSQETQININIDTAGLAKSVRAGVEKGFKNVSPSGIISSISRGAFEGLGRDLFGGLSKSFSGQIESVLGNTIGSSNLLGKKLAERSAAGIQNLVARVRNENPVVDQVLTRSGAEIRSFVGEKDIAIEVNRKRGQEVRKRDRDLNLAREGLVVERQEARENLSTAATELRQTKRRLEPIQQRIDRQDAPYQEKLRDINKQKIAETQRLITERNQRIGELVKQQETATTEAQRVSLSQQVSSVVNQPIYSKKLNQLDLQEKEVQRQRAPIQRTQDIIDSRLEPKLANFAVANQRFENVSRQTGQLLRKEQPKVYQDILDEIAPKIKDRQVPKLVLDPTIQKRGADADYDVTTNSIRLNPKTYAAVSSGGKLSDQDYRILREEAEHAKDLKFGQFAGLQSLGEKRLLSKPVKATPAEELEIAPELNKYAENVRPFERQAKINRDRALKRYQEEAALESLGQKVGLSGFEFYKATTPRLTNASSSISASQSAGVNSQVPAFDRIQSKYQQLEESQGKLHSKIRSALAGDVKGKELLGLEREIDRHIAQVKSIELRAANLQRKSSSLIGFEKEVRTTNPPAPIVPQIVQPPILDQIGDRLRTAGGYAQKAGSFAQKVGSPIAQFAQNSYNTLQGVENAVLPFVPFGKQIKSVGKNVAFPAAAYAGLGMLPGGAAAQSLLGGAAHSLLSLPGAGITEAVAGAVGSAFGSVPLIGHALQAGAGTLTSGSMEALATTLTPIVAGKVALQLAGKGAKLALPTKKSEYNYVQLGQSTTDKAIGAAQSMVSTSYEQLPMGDSSDIVPSPMRGDDWKVLARASIQNTRRKLDAAIKSGNRTIANHLLDQFGSQVDEFERFIAPEVVGRSEAITNKGVIGKWQKVKADRARKIEQIVEQEDNFGPLSSLSSGRKLRSFNPQRGTVKPLDDDLESRFAPLAALSRRRRSRSRFNPKLDPQAAAFEAETNSLNASSEFERAERLIAQREQRANAGGDSGGGGDAINYIADRFNRSLGSAQTTLGIDSLSSGLSKLTGAFAGLVIVGTVGAAIKGFGAEALATSDKLERLEIKLQQSTGSLSKGRERFNQLSQTAADLKISRTSALTTGAGFAGTTLGGDLEGLPTDRLVNNALAFNKVRGQSKTEIDGTRVALLQMLSKSKVSTEELNQLAESGGITDARGLGARALGLTPQQFTKSLESTAGIDSQRFVSRFLTQGVAEAKLTEDRSLNTIDSKQQGLSNQVENFQAAIGGGITPAYKAGLDLLTKSMELLTQGVEIGSKVLIGFALYSIPAAISGLVKLGQTAYLATGQISALTALKSIGTMGLWGAAFFAAGAAVEYFSYKLKSSTEDIDKQVEGINKLIREYDKLAGLKPTAPKIVGLQSELSLSGNANFIDTFFGNLEKNFASTSKQKSGQSDADYAAYLKRTEGNPLARYETKSAKELRDQQTTDKSIDLLNPGLERQRKDSLKAVNEINRIDAQIQAKKTQRAGISQTRPDDAESVQKLTTDIIALNNKRATLDGKIALPKTAIDAQIKAKELLKDTIESTIAGRKDKDSTKEEQDLIKKLDADINKLKTTQKEYNKETRSTLDSMQQWALTIDVIKAKFDGIGSKIALIKSNAEKLVSVKFQTGQLTEGQREASQQRIEQSARITKSVELESIVKSLSLSLEDLGKGTEKRIKSAYKLNDKSTAQEIEVAASKTSDERDKVGLKALALKAQAIQDLQLNNNEIVTSQNAVRTKLREQGLSIAEYYNSVAKSSADLQNEIAKSLADLKAHEITGTLRSKLGGVNDSISGYFNGLLDLADEAGKQFTIEQERQLRERGIRAEQRKEKLNNVEKRYNYNDNQPGQTDNSSSGGESGLISPINGGTRSSGFGYRNHPVKGGKRFHAGDDFAIPVNTPIKAAGDGKVTFAGMKGGYGNTVDIQHPNGEMTRYAHLLKITAELGQVVKQGEIIARSGGAKGAPGSGTSTGPHLHFETRDQNGNPINPKERLKRGGSVSSPVSMRSGGADNTQAILRVIANGEVREPDSRKGYFQRNGKGYFPESETYQGFPASVADGQNVGRYQVNRQDFNLARRSNPNIKGFGPEDQDLIAIERSKQPGRKGRDKGYTAMQRLKADPTFENFVEWRKDAGAEWESLRDGTIEYPGINRKDKSGRRINYLARQGKTDEKLYALYLSQLGQQSAQTKPVSKVVPIKSRTSIAPDLNATGRKLTQSLTPNLAGIGNVASSTDPAEQRSQQLEAEAQIDRDFNEKVNQSNRQAEFDTATVRNNYNRKKRELEAAQREAKRQSSDQLRASQRLNQDRQLATGPDTIAKNEKIAEVRDDRAGEDQLLGLNRNLEDTRIGRTRLLDAQKYFKSTDLSQIQDPTQRATLIQARKDLPSLLAAYDKKEKDLLALIKAATATQALVKRDTARKVGEELKDNTTEQRRRNSELTIGELSEQLKNYEQTLSRDPLNLEASAGRFDTQRSIDILTAGSKREGENRNIDKEVRDGKILELAGGDTKLAAKFEAERRTKIESIYKKSIQNIEARSVDAEQDEIFKRFTTNKGFQLSQSELANAGGRLRLAGAEIADRQNPYAADTTPSKKANVAYAEIETKLERELLSLAEQRYKYQRDPVVVANLDKQKQAIIENAKIERANIKEQARIDVVEQQAAKSRYELSQREGLQNTNLSISQSLSDGKRFRGEDTRTDDFRAEIAATTNRYNSAIENQKIEKSKIIGDTKEAVTARENIDKLIESMTRLKNIDLSNIADKFDSINIALKTSRDAMFEVLDAFIKTGKINDPLSIIRKPIEQAASQYLNQGIDDLYRGLFKKADPAKDPTKGVVEQLIPGLGNINKVVEPPKVVEPIALVGKEPKITAAVVSIVADKIETSATVDLPPMPEGNEGWWNDKFIAPDAPPPPDAVSTPPTSMAIPTDLSGKGFGQSSGGGTYGKYLPSLLGAVSGGNPVLSILGSLFAGTFADGGVAAPQRLTHGIIPGYSAKDDTLALVMKGEGFLSIPTVDKIGGNKGIDALRAGKIPPKLMESVKIPMFADGGVVGGNAMLDRPQLPDYVGLSLANAKSSRMPSFSSTKLAARHDTLTVHVKGDFDKVSDPDAARNMVDMIQNMIYQTEIDRQRSRA